MPKSNTSKSTPAKKPPAKATPPKKPVAKASAKSVPSKPATKASAAKPAATKAPLTKPVASKPTPAKSLPAKPAPKAPAKPAPAASAKTPAKPGSTAAPKPVAGKPTSVPKGGLVPAKPVPAPVVPPPSAAQAGKPGDPKKAGPKGITIVTPRPMRKPKVKKLEMPISEPLLKPGAKWKPLIASGPKAPAWNGGTLGGNGANDKSAPKAKMPKKDLDKYKLILLQKRSELIGDVRNMEEEALRTSSGSLSSLPQHMAEQGSDTFEQSLSLDLAQVDRNLIREIDEALKRIENGTYGVCLLTGKIISAERLAELPWAKYSIEAARELELRPYLAVVQPQQ